VGRVTWRG
jgi:hypothetical protein